MLRIGSLCSGYGGLDMAVESFFGACTAWFSEFDAAPSRVLERRWPGVPNLGDMTAINWAAVEPVDIVCAGTPCQDLATAGKRLGMREGTRSNLWVQMREAIAVIRPRVVVWENVRGALSAYASSEMESEQGLLGESYGPDRPALRALGRVLGDLAELGYDTEWVGLRAADAGAPHGRFRIFVVAYAVGLRRGEGWAESAGRVGGFAAVVGGAPSYASGDSGRIVDGDGFTAADTEGVGHQRRRQPRDRRGRFAHYNLAASDSARLGRGSGDQPSARREAGRADVIGEHAVPDAERGGWTWRARAAWRSEDDGAPAEWSGEDAVEWGPYRPAIRRWERISGRVAPSPTRPDGKSGAPRLSPPFVEWMMGLPAGWVTDPSLGLSRNEQLKALGNGVVPQQAALALSIAWPRVLESIEVAA